MATDTLNLLDYETGLPTIRELVRQEITEMLKGAFVIPDTYLSDGNTYGIRNGALEVIALDGEAVLVDDEDTAMSLALDALNSGSIPVIEDAQMAEEVKALIGADIWNDMLSSSVKTLALSPQLSDEQKLEKARSLYWERKAKAEERAKELGTTNTESI